MYNPQKHTDQSVQWTANDCRTSIACNPDNLKTPEYYKLMKDCEAEIYHREIKRMYRKIVKTEIPDEMTVKLSHRFMVRNNKTAYKKDRVLSAMLTLSRSI